MCYSTEHSLGAQLMGWSPWRRVSRYLQRHRKEARLADRVWHARRLVLRVSAKQFCSLKVNPDMGDFGI